MATQSLKCFEKVTEAVKHLPLPKTRTRQLDKGSRPFIDWRVVRAVGGTGGDGGIAFTHEAHRAIGQPSGGDGGRGGNVYLEVSDSLTDLGGIFKIYRGERGRCGSSGMCIGENGKDCILKVPRGTVIRRVRPPPSALEAQIERLALLESQSQTDKPAFLETFYKFADNKESFFSGMKQRILFARVKEFLERSPFEPASCKVAAETPLDLRNQIQPLDLAAQASIAQGQQLLLAKGGNPGFGNVHFAHTYASNFAAAARRGAKAGSKLATRGREGDDCFYELELKVLADIALIGLPNVGKSSLLAALTNAKPKIANYAFTTLNPYVGVLEFPRTAAQTATIADIPGIIKDASANAGLGHAFLRHAERAKSLLMVLDASNEQQPLHNQLELLLIELERYKPQLSLKCSLIVVNKMDLVDSADRVAAQVDLLERFKSQLASLNNVSIVLVSSKTKQNISRVKDVIKELCK